MEQIKLTDFQVQRFSELAVAREQKKQEVQALEKELGLFTGFVLDANGYERDLKVRFEMDKKILKLPKGAKRKSKIILPNGVPEHDNAKR